MGRPGNNPLRGERGASLIIALVLFLICSMVAAVVVGFAGADVERVKQRTATEADYQALLSAMELAVSNPQLNQEMTVTYTPADYKPDPETGENVLVSPGHDNLPPTWFNDETNQGEICDWLRASAYAVYAPSSQPAPGPTTFEVKAYRENGDVLTDEQGNPLVVEVTYSMNSSYGIEITTELADQSRYAKKLTASIPPYNLTSRASEASSFHAEWNPESGDTE